MASYQLGVNKAGRPYRLHPADDGREFRSELLAMPPIEELLASLETLSKEEILVKAFARGATVGFSRGLAKRNELIGELIALEMISLVDLRVATQISDTHLRKILRNEGVPAAQPDRSGPRVRRKR